MIGHKIN